MDQDVIDWTRKAVELAQVATATNVLVLFRNDDWNIVVTNAQTAPEIRELGKAVAGGYGEEE